MFMACCRGAERASLSSTPTAHLLGNSLAAQMQTRNQTHHLKTSRCPRPLLAAGPQMAPHRPIRILMRRAASRTPHGNPVPPASGRVSKVSKRSYPIQMQPEWVEMARDSPAWFGDAAE